MTTIVLEFRPISELDDIPEDRWDRIVVRGGLESSGPKDRPYDLHSVWRDDNGQFWVDRFCTVEVIDPVEFAIIPEGTMIL